MSYLVLARKYRPASFCSISGQEQVTRTLANSIKRNRIAHAYLFAGPRGVGKTSIARIFSKALNCKDGPTTEPCLQCANCVEIAQGTSLAVREIDGASHNSVDNVRELIDSFRSLPAPGSRYKIYIIDEVHMLSMAAFNALLKSLEEPPPNTVFILATTEPHKIPETVISRCQRHDFRELRQEEIETQLKNVVREEGVAAEPEALRMITRLADGSMRDAQSLLERVIAFCDEKISAAETGRALGVAERRVLHLLSQAVFARQSSEALAVVAEAFSTGLDPALFLREFASYWRELLLAKFGGDQALTKLGVTEEERVEMLRQVHPVTSPDLQDLAQLAREGADSALRSSYPRYALEALVVRMCTRESVRELGTLLAALKRGAPPQDASRAVPARESAPVVAAPPKPARAQEADNSPKVSAERGGTRPLEWAEFVRFAGDKGARMVAEHLKRLSVERFSAGVLEASGPEFSITSLEQKENREKLLQLLASFSDEKVWKTNFKKLAKAADAPPGSLLHTERQEEIAQSKEQKEAISTHSTIRSLQKVFPGSKIEEIKPKS